MIRERNLDPSLRMLLGGGYANRHYVFKAGTAGETYFSKAVPDGFRYNTIAAAHANMTSGQNDIVFLSPDSHSQAAGLVWSKSNSNLIGQSGPGMIGHRSRIGHSANFDTLLTVSGSGNYFENLYLMHGRGSSSNVHCLEVTGDHNTFYNCDFAGPLNATEGDAAGYSCVELTGAANAYFNHCKFGQLTVPMSAANCILRIGPDTGQCIFDSCVFFIFADAATPYFIEVLSTNVGNDTLMFRNCQFICSSTNWATSLTLAINVASGTGATRLFFTPDCFFSGVTDIVAAAKEAAVLFGTVPTVTVQATDDFVGLMINPDHTP